MCRAYNNIVDLDPKVSQMRKLKTLLLQHNKLSRYVWHDTTRHDTTLALQAPPTVCHRQRHTRGSARYAFGLPLPVVPCHHYWRAQTN